MSFYLVYERRDIRRHNDNELPVIAYEQYFELWYLYGDRCEFVAFASIYDGKMHLTPKGIHDLPTGAMCVMNIGHRQMYRMTWDQLARYAPLEDRSWYCVGK